MKIAIYSCVAGGYDKKREPKVLEDECDYFMISDDRELAGESVTWIDIDKVVPSVDMSPKDKNRFCKMHPHSIFSDYDYSIYYDGSIQIVKPISHNISLVGRSGLAIHRHRERDCIYSEGIFLSWLGAVDKELLIKDIERYARAGVPKHFGLFECGMIVTDLKNPISLELYKNWYMEYLIGAKRDQQALIYTLWSMGMTPDDIGDIGGEYNVLTNPDISWDRGAHYR
ncbi:glycosyltransferase domain-containing protein [Butyrivibrio sp. XB500-5]|uniref:glycosyltransferase domain-containing protein n=1 Tax=Butyrivibrio sp. XB500-5 TaxID=2364880 RepID=UPI0013146686|nr:glycosyltransferase domain-containing protein [Butyrivibrio sp. XB500-5]